MRQSQLQGLALYFLCWVVGLVLADDFQLVSNETALRWGPYRPGLYVGVRPIIPKTLLTGVMWSKGDSRDSILRGLRDTCNQEDKVTGYGWTSYDTRTGGVHMVHDDENFIDLKTEFLKNPDGESWGLRVTGTPLADASPTTVKTALIFHIAMEEMSDSQRDVKTSKSLKCQSNDFIEAGRKVVATCHGSDPQLGGFQLRVFGSQQNKVIEDTVIHTSRVTEDKIWQAKEVFTSKLKSSTNSKGKPTVVLKGAGEGNMHFIQTVLQAPFTVDFIYSSRNATDRLTPAGLAGKLIKFRKEFPSQVDVVFPRAAPFYDPEYAGFTQYLLSNLLGGLGFFHGDSKVDDSHSPAYNETEPNFWQKAAAQMKQATITTAKPTSLLSHTPSRPFFPRGFLWDEGFHLLPVLEWDFDLAITVLKSWLSLMDDSGWIGREQILGPEARSKVPSEFQVQYPHYANPPTLLLLVPHLLDKITKATPYHGNNSTYLSSDSAASALLEELYPLLERHYNWFRKTQAGDLGKKYPRPPTAIVGEAYRWRGRTLKHCLTSGLDDYPRADPPHPGELHVDALAWVAASASALEAVAHHLGKSQAANTFAQQLEAMKHNLDVLHWDPDQQAYCDGTVVGEQYQRVCHQGYISLLPFLLGLMEPKDPKLSAVLNLLGDPQRLWSPHGIRSLSVKDAHYGKDEDYWRGAIWMNMNVLAVLRLSELGQHEGPEGDRARTLAGELRERVVKTVYNSWKDTGHIWEQYEDKNGQGRRSKAFTGWTACVLLLMGLKDNGQRATGMYQGILAKSSWWLSPQIVLAFAVVMTAMVVLRRRLGVVWRRMTRPRKGRFGPHIHMHEM